ncbi:phosphoenolpyruvate carboxykinase (ATP) [Ichthyobacterium seriolicida]|uniref:Phosphoenolpyruvate carboxykinase (ATP) n=1 Tax=Ichthyobacterium seriolicida TaxID=242600 RepID=A0A1J1DY42_9FLAO|nr:phosphoenolpyruvate carboxykinase (ATP) [Ichthyobacterium seriolicida]BAV94777.1 phosphoenolpyruvate carboxykinase [Ichthyobacterium seriolicida]
MTANNLEDQNRELEKYGIKNSIPLWNLEPMELQKITIEKGLGKISSTGALSINTGKFTGRSPKDRFIVEDDITKDTIWWGSTNIPFSSKNFDILYQDLVDYLSNREIYIRDAQVCSDPLYKTDIRIITELPWSNIFAYNMFIRPTEEYLKSNFDPEWIVLNAPGFSAKKEIHQTRQENFSILNFSKKIAIIGGSAYTGEIKKGIFSTMNFVLPTEKNVLPMHCSANVGNSGDTAIFFGLSGTGKTTLSADPNRKLIGDDEHGWSSENKIFNFEGGCYAKAIGLCEENEPDIFRAVKQGAILENIIFKEGTNEVDYYDSSITENTRVSYPIEHIENIKVPSIGENLKNIFFLTCDAFGVLPPLSKLTPNQAAFYFISGYTAKVAGTEDGVVEPIPSFSACFGEPFMPLHPTKYAEMLSDKIQSSKAKVWLINTGWSGGPYGVGERISIKYTRSMITAALEDKLDSVPYNTMPIFGLSIPTECPNIPSDLLDPRNTWKDKSEYDKKLYELAVSFNKNFEKFANCANKEILSSAPSIKKDTVS